MRRIYAEFINSGFGANIMRQTRLLGRWIPLEGNTYLTVSGMIYKEK
jgi:hypothetical protein